MNPNISIILIGSKQCCWRDWLQTPQNPTGIWVFGFGGKCPPPTCHQLRSCAKSPAMVLPNETQLRTVSFLCDQSVFDYMVQKFETRVIIIFLKSCPKSNLGNLEKENRVAKTSIFRSRKLGFSHQQFRVTTLICGKVGPICQLPHTPKTYYLLKSYVAISLFFYTKDVFCFLQNSIL